MSNELNKYPLSSCDCYKCNENNYTFPSGNPTNFSVRDCKISDYYDCYNKKIFKNQTEPEDKIGYCNLNPNVCSEKMNDQTFRPRTYGECPSNCYGTTWESMDPRLFNSAGPSRLQLDRMPLNSSVKLNTLYNDKKLDSYGQGYKTYSDINAGDYLYYIDKSTEDAFYKPNFSKQAQTIGVLYKDPMDNMKPHYDRVFTVQKNPLTSSGCATEYCLSWIDDTQRHREDLLSKQMWKKNQERWEPRWTNMMD